MILRHRSLPLIRLSLLAAALFGLTLVVAVDSRSPEHVGADPAFGTVRPSPSSGVVIEGHVFSLPVQMTTCADNTTPISGTATSGSVTTLVNTGAAWTTNQWAGYDIQLTSGTSSPQWRVIASNTSNTITVSEAWGGILDTGTATAGSTTTLTDTGSGWLTNEFAGKSLEMPALGVGQTRTISSNTVDTITISPAWTTLVATQNPSATGTSNTLIDNLSWASNAYIDKTVQITSGPASGQSRRIVSNDGTTLTIDGTWTTATGGTLTGVPTTTVLEDVSKTWTPGAFVGMTLEMLTGAQMNQPRTITANSATTITINALPGAPGFGDAYRVLQVPTVASQYIVREGPAIGTVFQTKQSAPPASGTGYQLFKSACRVGGYDVNVAFNDAVTSPEGTADSPFTTTTLKDTGKTWTTNQWNGKLLVLTGGTGAGQKRTIISNTADTLTISGSVAWTVTPNATTTYEIPLGEFAVASDAGVGTSVNTSTTFNDGTATWKTNAWAGSRILIVGGVGTSQTRQVVSNTATQLVVTPAWSIPQPTTGSVYQVGGITTSNFVENTGRVVTCPTGAAYTSTSAEIHCASYESAALPNGDGLPQGPTGVGNLVNVSMLATGRGLSTFTLTSQVLEVDGAVIPADVLNATRRVILCPDSAGGVIPPNPHDGVINSGDQGATAQAIVAGAKGPPYQSTADPLYAEQKDPNEDGQINSGDMGVLAAVYLKRCIQP